MVFTPASWCHPAVFNGADANDHDLIRQVWSRPVKELVKRCALMGSIQQPEPSAVKHAEQWREQETLNIKCTLYNGCCHFEILLPAYVSGCDLSSPKYDINDFL